MSSLFEAMAEASAKAMQGYALGKAIGDARDRASVAENDLEFWYNHAQELDGLVDRLHLKLKRTETARSELELKLKNTEIEFSEYKKWATTSINDVHVTVVANMKYGKEIKIRLQQMEKGLQHSSADAAYFQYIYKIYKEIVEKIGANEQVPLDIKEKADSVWTTFVGGGKLTENPHIQKMIDETPMPVATERVQI